MKWPVGVFTVLIAVSAGAPTLRNKTMESTNEGRSSTEAITIETATQNIFDNVVSITPPDTESIELRQIHDDTRFYPDYGDKDTVDKNHFTEAPHPEESLQVDKRPKRDSYDSDYDALNFDMYLDPDYSRERRSADTLDPDYASASSSNPDISMSRITESEPDSISTQVTYVIISEDDTSSSDEVDVIMNRIRNRTIPEESPTTEVIDIIVPSSEVGTTNSDDFSAISSSSSSSDSTDQRYRVLRAISNTIRKRNLSQRRRRSNEDTDKSTSSEHDALLRNKRQMPWFRTDITNYRVGRSTSSESLDSDDTEPDDSHDVSFDSIDGADPKPSDYRVMPLPEYASEFSELVNPSSTFIDGRLSSSSDETSKRESKRSLPVQSEPSHSNVTDERETTIETTSEGIDVVTASYPLGIDATKENLSLPEGNFLGPRVYARGNLVAEEEPSVTDIVAPMEKEQTIPVQNGSGTETIYSAPVKGMNLPLIIPVVAPTSHPGEEPRIELSVPSGFVPLIIQLSPTPTSTSESHDNVTQTVKARSVESTTIIVEATSTATEASNDSLEDDRTTVHENQPISSVTTPMTTVFPLNGESPQASPKEENKSVGKDMEITSQSFTAKTTDKETALSTSTAKQPVDVQQEASSLPLKQHPSQHDMDQSASSAFSGRTPEDATKAVTDSADVVVTHVTLPSSEAAAGEPDVSDGEIATPKVMERKRTKSRESNIPILENSSVMSPNGSFSYSYKSANGIQVEESGYLKEKPPSKSGEDASASTTGVVQTVQGSYSYTAPDGRLISVRYVADENGFRPQGNDLPR